MNPFEVIVRFKSYVEWDTGSFNNWKYRSPTTVFLEKKAKCFDAINFLHKQINDSKIILYKENRQDHQPIVVRDDEDAVREWIHGNLMFTYLNKYWLFEWYWCDKYRSIFGPYDSEEELFDNWLPVMKDLIEKRFETSFEIVVLPYKNPPYGSNLVDFQTFVLSQ